MKYKLLNLILIFLILSLLLTGCEYGQIEDTNGEEDYSIQTILDDKIKEGPNTRYVINSKWSTKDNVTTMKIEKFSGLFLLRTTHVTNKTLTYEIDSIVEKGNFKIVIVKNNEEIINVLINSTELVTINDAEGKYQIKAVGESAKFKMSCEIYIE